MVMLAVLLDERDLSATCAGCNQPVSGGVNTVTVGGVILCEECCDMGDDPVIREASELGLPPGHFPSEVVIDGVTYTLAHAVYVNGSSEAHVLND
jgi:hypothetical protein